jgi:ribosomal protein S18 acetylase RimI-like enzyme
MEYDKQEVILKLLERIYPELHAGVEDALAAGKVREWRYFADQENPGAFCLVEYDDLVVAYLSFERDVEDEEALVEIRTALEAYFPPKSSKEFCFNLYGRNPRGIQFAQSLGFKLDLLGVRMRRRSTEALPEPESALEERGFELEDTGRFAGLFERAYRQVNLDNGKAADGISRNLDGFRHHLAFYQQQGGFAGYWLGEILVGACLYAHGMIHDLVVEPQFQGQGLGSLMLARCVNQHLPQIELSAAASNRGAIRFYQRYGFAEMGCFADHTWGL